MTAAAPPVGTPAGLAGPLRAPSAAPGEGKTAPRGPGLSLLSWSIYLGAVAIALSGVGGRLANFAYLGAAGLAGLLLYLRAPGQYVSFVLWLWFVTPFIRRVLDMHHGWNPTNPVLLAPPAVALLSTFTILRKLKELRGNLYAPYLLVLGAFGYGYVVGIINAGLVPATYALVTWLAPGFFGLHLGLSWRRYPEIAEATKRTFMIALPVLAMYGLYQFVRLPRWDSQWMINADMRSIGAPLPFLVRVFGTLNTPGPFAAFLCAGALLLLPQRGRLRFLPIGLGIVVLLLTRTRAVWVAFLIGLFIQQLGQPLRKMPRYVITLILVSIVAIPIVNMPRFSQLIAPRIATFGNLSEDNSLIKRYNFSEQAANSIVQTAEGNGLGATGGAVKLRVGGGVVSLDNGFLEVFYIFGWTGGMLFFLGIGGILLQSFRFRETGSDPFANSARSIAVALIAILPIGDVFTSATGTLLWMGVGFGIGAHSYHLVTGRALRSWAWTESMRRAARGAPPASMPPPAVPTGAAVALARVMKSPRG